MWLVPVVSHADRADVRATYVGVLDHRPDGATVGALVFGHVQTVGRYLLNSGGTSCLETLHPLRPMQPSRLRRYDHTHAPSHLPRHEG